MKEGKVALGTIVLAATIINLLAVGQVHPIPNTIGIISIVTDIIAFVLIGVGLSELETFQFEIGKNIGRKENISRVVTLRELTKILDAKSLKFTVLMSMPTITSDCKTALAIANIEIRKIVTNAGEETNLEKWDSRFVYLEQEGFGKIQLGATYSIFDGKRITEDI